jgi:hypothetical protein
VRPRDPIEWREQIRGARPPSPAWRAVVRAAWGAVPLTCDERSLFLRLSGGVPVPEGGTDDLFVLKGRRGGGTEEIAWCVTFECIFGGHEAAGAPGQTLVAGLVTPEQKHAREMIGYMRGIAQTAQVKKHVAKVTDDAVTFKTGVEARIITANEQAVAATYIMAVFDEAARLPGPESATPDRAIIGSFEPGMAPVRGAPRRKKILITSAFVESGVAWETDRDCFGRADADTLVVRGSTEVFNPNIDRAWLARQRRKDPLAALREYGDGDTPPQWMPSIVEGWFGADVVAGCVDRGRGTLGYELDRPHYVTVDAAFTRDNFGIAVGRNDYSSEPWRTVVVHVDAFRPPRGGTLSPRECVTRTIEVMRRYWATRVYLDQYAAVPLIEAFAEQGVQAIQIPWTGSGATSKAARYRDVREAMRDGLVRLPDDPALLREFHRVRGHITQSGHESIEATGRGVDDRVSAVVMACSIAREGAARGRQKAANDARALRIIDSLPNRGSIAAGQASELRRKQAFAYAHAEGLRQAATPEGQDRDRREWEKVCRNPPKMRPSRLIGGGGGGSRRGLW